MSEVPAVGYNDEILTAIEDGFSYWQSWFKETSAFDITTPHDEPYDIVRRPLKDWRCDNQAIIEPIVDGTRELAFTVIYEDGASYHAFQTMLSRLICQGDTRNLEDLSEPVVKMAHLASILCTAEISTLDSRVPIYYTGSMNIRLLIYKRRAMKI